MNSLNPKIGKENIEQEPTRKGYGLGVLDLGEEDKNVVVLTADLAESTMVLDFAKKYPERFVECGVAEQNMMGVAAGLALYGKTAFVSSYATFSPGRSWDQLRVSVCYSMANVKVAGAHTGVTVGPDGATHQALEDVAITRVLPNLTVVVPCDAIEARKATVALGRMQGPAYFRLGRSKTPVITTEETPFKVGKAEVFREGKDVAIIASGPVLYNGLLAAIELEKEGISVMVVNNHTIKPIDVQTIVNSAKKCGAVVTLEETSEAFKAGYRNISELSRTRLDKSGNQLKESTDFDGDIGFRTYRLIDSNFSKWDGGGIDNKEALQQSLNLVRESSDDSATEQDLLTEIVLRLGLEPTAKIRHSNIDGLSVWDIEEGTVVAYLNEHQKPVLDQLRSVVALEPAKLVVIEDSFKGDDQLKTNLVQDCKSKNIDLWTV